MSRVSYSGERFIIERRGKAVAALVKLEDLGQFKEPYPSVPARGVLAAIGAWETYPDLDGLVAHLYRKRSRAKDRRVSLR